MIIYCSITQIWTKISMRILRRIKYNVRVTLSITNVTGLRYIKSFYDVIKVCSVCTYRLISDRFSSLCSLIHPCEILNVALRWKQDIHGLFVLGRKSLMFQCDENVTKNSKASPNSPSIYSSWLISFCWPSYIYHTLIPTCFAALWFISPEN